MTEIDCNLFPEDDSCAKDQDWDKEDWGDKEDWDKEDWGDKGGRGGKGEDRME